MKILLNTLKLLQNYNNNWSTRESYKRSLDTSKSSYQIPFKSHVWNNTAVHKHLTYLPTILFLLGWQLGQNSLLCNIKIHTTNNHLPKHLGLTHTSFSHHFYCILFRKHKSRAQLFLANQQFPLCPSLSADVQQKNCNSISIILVNNLEDSINVMINNIAFSGVEVNWSVTEECHTEIPKRGSTEETKIRQVFFYSFIL